MSDHGQVLSALSPRRRLLVLVMLVVVAILGGTALIARLTSSAASMPRSRPSQAVPGPVLLVPGYGGRAAAFDVMLARLTTAGRSASVVALPGGATGDLREQARAVNRAVNAALTAGARSVDLVGYSAGGVVVRLWAREYNGDRKARRIVTLGSPHHGTEVAALAGAVAPAECVDACAQLEPGSSLLRELNAGDETPAGPQWLSLWTTVDELVTPPSTASLAGAVDVPLQSVCPDDRVGHGLLPADPLAVGLTLAALAAAPIAAPGPADCARLRALGG